MKISWMELVLGAEAARYADRGSKYSSNGDTFEPVIPRCFPTCFWRWKLCFYHPSWKLLVV